MDDDSDGKFATFRRRFLSAIGAPEFDPERTADGLALALTWDDPLEPRQDTIVAISDALDQLFVVLADGPDTDATFRLATRRTGEQPEAFAERLREDLRTLAAAVDEVRRRCPRPRGQPKKHRIRQEALNLVWLAFAIRRERGHPRPVPNDLDKSFSRLADLWAEHTARKTKTARPELGKCLALLNRMQKDSLSIEDVARLQSILCAPWARPRDSDFSEK